MFLVSFSKKINFQTCNWRRQPFWKKLLIRTRWYIEMTLETYWMRAIFVTVVVIFFCGISCTTKFPKDFFLRKITICGMGIFLKKNLKICSFSGHGLSVNLNQNKIIYRSKYKTSNFEKLEFLVAKKFCYFEFD